MVGSDQGSRLIVGEISNFGVNQYRNALVSNGEDLFQDARRYHALVVIRNNKGVCILKGQFQRIQNVRLDLPVNWSALLPVGSYPQLAMRNYARLGRRGPAFIDHQVLVSLQSAGFLQTRPQPLAGGIISYDPDDASFGTQRDKVGKYIRSTPQMDRLPADVHHRYRCLGRNARDVTPNKFVQHDVAEHDDLPIAHSPDQFLSALSC